MSTIQPRLQYSYAKIDLSTGRCKSCMTCSYEINNEAYILVPSASSDYVGKYYDRASGKWFYEPEFVTEFIPA